MIRDSVALLQLMQTKGVGARSLARLLDLLEQDHLSLNEFVTMAPEEITARFGLKREQALSIRGNEEIAAFLEEHNIRTVLRGDDRYPSRLKSVLRDKAPPVLFMAGTPDLLGRRGVGFCASRDASSEALRCTEQLAHA